MAVASDNHAARETLSTVAWCSKTFKSRTILGLSNVSFGMPGRPWLNAAFLAMAQYCGLTMAIANPASVEFMHVKKRAIRLSPKKRRRCFLSTILPGSPLRLRRKRLRRT